MYINIKDHLIRASNRKLVISTLPDSFCIIIKGYDGEGEGRGQSPYFDPSLLPAFVGTLCEG